MINQSFIHCPPPNCPVLTITRELDKCTHRHDLDWSHAFNEIKKKIKKSSRCKQIYNSNEEKKKGKMPPSGTKGISQEQQIITKKKKEKKD